MKESTSTESGEGSREISKCGGQVWQKSRDMIARVNKQKERFKRSASGGDLLNYPSKVQPFTKRRSSSTSICKAIPEYKSVPMEESTESDESSREISKDGGQARQKWRDMIARVNKRKEQFKRSESGGDLLNNSSNVQPFTKRRSSSTSMCKAIPEYKSVPMEESTESDEGSREISKDGGQARQKWRDMIARVNKRKERFKRSASGGDLLNNSSNVQPFTKRRSSSTSMCKAIPEYKDNPPKSVPVCRRKSSLQTAVTLDIFSPASSSGSIETSDDQSEATKSVDHARRSWKNLFGIVKKRRHQFKKTPSGGYLLQGISPAHAIPNPKCNPSASCNSITSNKDERLYQGLITSLLHPPAPKDAVEALENNLLDYIRESYNVHKDDHTHYIRQGLTNRISEENGDFSSEDYYKVLKHFLNHDYAESTTHADHHLGQLSLQAHMVLQKFAEANGISKISQTIVNVTCLLDVSCENNGIESIDFNIKTALGDLQKTWISMQVGDEQDCPDRMPLTDSELAHFRRAARRLIDQKSERFNELVQVFPATLESLNVIKNHLGIPVQLLSLDLWEPRCNLKLQLCKHVLEKLHAEASTWIETEILKIPESNLEIMETVIPESQRVIEFVNITSSHCDILPANKEFYDCLGINYYKVVSIIAEEKICSLSTDTIQELTKYKKKYNSFSVNIVSASKLSLSLYFALRTFRNVLRDNISSRDFFRSKLFNYQDWFEESLIYWLQTFRTESISRIEKALEIEKEVVAVTNRVKYSNSSVDSLSCLAKVISEWKNIGFKDADCVLMGVTQITDIVCDGSRIYAHKVQTLVEKNCFFEDNPKVEFNVKNRLCINLNNIEHVRRYLGELPELMAWTTVVKTYSMAYDSENVGIRAMDTLKRLVDTCNEEILTKLTQLLKGIVEKMKVYMDSYMELFMKKERTIPTAVDQFLCYISINIQTLHDTLMPDLYSIVLEELWIALLKGFSRQMLVGKKIEYYTQLKQHLQAVHILFHRAGLTELKLQSPLYDDIKEKLELNCMKSEELMLLYQRDLVKDLRTPPDRYGHLAFKAAYSAEVSGNMTIYMIVLRGKELAGSTPQSNKNTYVEVSLQPEPFFAWCRPQKTRVVKQGANPVFNERFEFPNVSKEYLHIEGSIILLTAYKHESIGWDTFAGEVVVNIQSLPRIDVNNTLDDLPAVIMSMKRPRKPLDGPFAILSQRDWDKPSKAFVTERLRFMDHQPSLAHRHGQRSQRFLTEMFSNILK